MFDWLKNKTVNRDRYKTHSQAVIVACFYNPLNSPYRLLAFQKWYRKIKHLDHRIIECLIGPEAKPQLPESKYIKRIHTESLLWHKESLLNLVISDLPKNYQYVFWLDTDVLFTNQNWLVESVKQLQNANIIQPFEYCVHLKCNQLKPDFNVDAYRATVGNPSKRHSQLWRSFCANYVTGDITTPGPELARDKNYDRHGHVGFAWGARRDALDTLFQKTGKYLYDKALIGGADHIIAHAAAGHIPHECISKSFTDNIKEVEDWSGIFDSVMRGRIGYVHGDLYHIWHGEIQNRQYLKRIRDFTEVTKQIQQKDKHGLYVKPGDNKYMMEYYRQREVSPKARIAYQQNEYDDGFDFNDEFFEDMGYTLMDLVNLFSSDDAVQPVELPVVAGSIDLEAENSVGPVENFS